MVRCMMRNNKGFVMIETIIVICVLSIGLISLYSSYSLILSKTNTKSTYDNSEYLYKTYFVAKELKLKNITSINGNIEEKTSSIDQIIKDNFKIKAVYLTKMNPSSVNLLSLDGTTINYIRTLNDYDDANSNDLRIIVKYEEESIYNAEIKKTNFASLDYSLLINQ